LSTHENWLVRTILWQAKARRTSDSAFGVISDLTEVNLEKLGIPFGHRKRMFKAIGALAGASRATDTDQATITPPRLSAERRQLTSLFCDLVDSTASGVHWRAVATCPPTLLGRADEVIE
jgi:hypothetical protein